jgi:LysR family glycine cleavage system transcriptional activator
MANRLLPSCQSLRAFEAAARHESFTRAAEEVHLTQGAVSQQIKLLEDRLQTKLFLRSGRKLSLTSAGERLYRPARALLAQLQLFVDLAQSQGDTEALIVHAPHCFATKWLAPRLPDFQAQHPDVRIWLKAETKTPDVLSEEDSVAITLAEQEDSTSVHTEYLGVDKVIPVCSPRLLSAGSKFLSPHDLPGHRLLHAKTAGRENCCCDWSLWPSHLDGEAAAQRPTICFSNCAMALEAASAGHGIALARGLIVESELKQGLLVRPFEGEVPSPHPYCFLYPKSSSHESKIVTFRRWLSAQFRTALWQSESGRQLS